MANSEKLFRAYSSLLGAVTGRGAFATTSANFIQVTHGPAGTSAEAGRNRQTFRSRIARLVALCSALSARIRRGNRSPAIAGEVAGYRASIIGRRAERLNNRNRAAASRYVEVHSILDRGRA